MKFLTALEFLTIIPLPKRREATPEEIGHSTGYFPVVGVIIGLILAGLNWLFSLFLPSAVANGLLIVSIAVISGALHLDGFVDTCDGIAGHKTVEDRWRVMHDSRTGAFGIIGVVLLLLIKYVSLNSIPQNLLMTTLILMPVVSRWVMVYTVFAYPYARPAGLGKIFKQGTGWRSFIAATLVALAVALILARLAGLVIIIATWVVAVGIAAYLKRKFSGLTGDTYGALNEVAEVCVLLLVCLMAHNQWLV